MRTILKFGYKEGEKEVAYDIREGQEAYEFFMVARYLKDIIAYRTNKVSRVHHKDDLLDNIKKYAALCVCKTPKPLIYYEIGSSLMGVIDSLEFIERNIHNIDIKKIKFIGIDNSDMMNHVASYTHSGYDLELFKKIKTIKCDLFFAKGVSILYAIDDEEKFANILNNSKLAVFDYTFSLKDSFKKFVGTGKPTSYLSFDKCVKHLQKDGRTLVLLSPFRNFGDDVQTKTYDCIYGERNMVKKYFKEFNKLKSRMENFL